MKTDRSVSGLKDLAIRMRDARTAKGLSQRGLSRKIGVPQSHISKIEAGKVDLQVSSLIEMARALDLELMLVSRPLVPAIEALDRPALHAPAQKAERGLVADSDTKPAKDPMLRALENVHKAAKTILRQTGDVPEISRLAEATQGLASLAATMDRLKELQEAASEAIRKSTAPLAEVQKALKHVTESSEIAKILDANRAALKGLAQSTETFRDIRNRLAHGAAAPAVRAIPAYRLSDGDGDV